MGDQPLGPLLLRGLREAESMILFAILFLLDLPSLLGTLDLYPAWWVGIGWWLVLVAVGLIDIPIGIRHRFWGRAAWPTALFVLAVSTAAAASLPTAALLTPAHWTFGVVGWFGLLLFVDRRTRHVLVFILLHLAATVALLAWRGVLAEALVPLATVAVGVGSFQLAVVVATLVLRRTADHAAAVAVAQARAATEESVAREVHADREARYRALKATALPLLQGIADGSRSPTDRDVQRRAAVEAARLRRLFGEQGDSATPLAAEVQALVEVVERRGVTVRYATRPVEVEPPPEVRRSLVEVISGVLLVTARTARVTVGGSGSDVTVSVVTDGDVGGSGNVGPGGDQGRDQGSGQDNGVLTTTVVDEGRTWVEARWPVH